jgi:2-iminoacetate synthase ThiH
MARAPSRTRRRLADDLVRAEDARRDLEAARQSGDGMRDGFGRRIEYLRISVTDKCNLRCVYCMPEEGLPWLGRSQILSYEEIEQIVRTMAAMGLRRSCMSPPTKYRKLPY